MDADVLAAWEAAPLAAGAATSPATLEAAAPGWIAATVPGTAAAALRAGGRWNVDQQRNFDGEDWWYRCRFAADPRDPRPASLRFGGLATLADVWLNGHPLLRSENMFIAHRLPVGRLIQISNELLIRFRALTPHLAVQRSRPRWRTRLIESQQLRWVRTTLLGRMPGWTPPAPPVGPWRPVVFEREDPLDLLERRLRSEVVGTVGRVWLDARVAGVGDGGALPSARLGVGNASADLRVERQGSGLRVTGAVEVPEVERWWPHTHGNPVRYPARLELRAGSRSVAHELGSVGFRTVALDSRGGGFTILVNGIPIFCRGACWVPPDIVSLSTPTAELERTLDLVRGAGMNMLRVTGTTVPESDEFYERCDALGILVWQDFMFANMDYPAGDPAFSTGVSEEAGQLLDRLGGRPSLAVCCGGSEVAQQAAMLGLPADRWQSPLFGQLLPSLCRDRAPGVPWCEGSPSGGTFPFSCDQGVAHYYGVGAYRRPLEDARRAGVRFAAECLAFSNVPEPSAIESLLPAGQSPAHHPRWKARVPRDPGAGWDFEDVRDHYVEALFGERTLDLRRGDIDRYLSLGRVATAEIMQAVLSEWRRPDSTCRGALVLQLRDPWLGPGWGVLDADGTPKAAYHALARVQQPVALLATDEGLNGLALHLINEREVPLDAVVRVAVYQRGEMLVAEGERPVRVPARTGVTLAADGLLDGFRDLTYAYRFGPPGHDLVVATLSRQGEGSVLARAFHFPLGFARAPEGDPGLTAELASSRGGWQVTVSTRRLAQAVTLRFPGFVPEDNYFHLEPQGARTIRLAGPAGRTPSGQVGALNAAGPAALQVRGA